jgi:hypothetical protein
LWFSPRNWKPQDSEALTLHTPASLLKTPEPEETADAARATLSALYWVIAGRAPTPKEIASAYLPAWDEDEDESDTQARDRALEAQGAEHRAWQLRELYSLWRSLEAGRVSVFLSQLISVPGEVPIEAWYEVDDQWQFWIRAKYRGRSKGRAWSDSPSDWTCEICGLLDGAGDDRDEELTDSMRRELSEWASFRFSPWEALPQEVVRAPGIEAVRALASRPDRRKRPSRR